MSHYLVQLILEFLPARLVKLLYGLDSNVSQLVKQPIPSGIYLPGTDPSGICLPRTELLQSPFRTEFIMGSRSRRYRRSLRRHRRFCGVIAEFCGVISDP